MTRTGTGMLRVAQIVSGPLSTVGACLLISDLTRQGLPLPVGLPDGQEPGGLRLEIGQPWPGP